MYENFGAVVDGNQVTFKLFFPDKAKDPAQYIKGSLPKIQKIQVAGDFQREIGQQPWDTDAAPKMIKEDHSQGWLYSLTTRLRESFYQYRFYVTFENGDTRMCNDPCAKHGVQDSNYENSAFVVGGNRVKDTKPISKRLEQKDLIIYEMMIDDFTAKLMGSRDSQPAKSPLDLVQDKLDYLVELGINAIEFMPWTATIGQGFSWGYNPFLYFSVEDRFIKPSSSEPAEDLDRLFRLKRLIDELHRRDIHVIMDGVFNHVEEGAPGVGFPYYWLYQDPQDSPFIGSFEAGGFFKELNYENRCTQDFIFDVCKYWFDQYQIDGIRFDYTLGFFKRAGSDPGITQLIANLREYFHNTHRENITLMLEHLTDNRYLAISETIKIGATGCWYDPLMYQVFDAGASSNINPSMIRALNTSKDFAPGVGPVTYIEKHDHSTLVNKVGGSDRANNWFKTQPYAIALLTVPGAVMIHNGQEFGDEYFLPEEGPDRVRPRPMNWERSTDPIGSTLINLYKQLIQIRKDFPSLRSPHFYPDSYDEGQTHFNSDGYGVDVDKDVIIYHRWGTGENGQLERFMIVLNCSQFNQFVDVPFPFNGLWKDLLSGDQLQVQGFRLINQEINSNWGKIYYAKG